MYSWVAAIYPSCFPLITWVLSIYPTRTLNKVKNLYMPQPKRWPWTFILINIILTILSISILLLLILCINMDLIILIIMKSAVKKGCPADVCLMCNATCRCVLACMVYINVLRTLQLIHIHCPIFWQLKLRCLYDCSICCMSYVSCVKLL